MQLVIDTNGVQIKVRNKAFWIIGKKHRRQISPRRISSILISADCMIGSAAIRLAAKNEIPIFWENALGKIEARVWSPTFISHARIRRQQVIWSKSQDAVSWILMLFEHKLDGQIRIIRKLANRRKALKNEAQSTIKGMKSLHERCQQ